MGPVERLAQPGAASDGAAAGAGRPLIAVTVVCALGPQRLLKTQVLVPQGATAVQALRASGVAQQLAAGVLDTLALGLWGRACKPDTVLQPGDRLELTRPLIVDPKEARRLRYRRDGVRRKRGPSAAV